MDTCEYLLSFPQWLTEVDRHLMQMCGFESCGLPESYFRDGYQACIPPKEMAIDTLADSCGVA